MLTLVVTGTWEKVRRLPRDNIKSLQNCARSNVLDRIRDEYCDLYCLNLCVVKIFTVKNVLFVMCFLKIDNSMSFDGHNTIGYSIILCVCVCGGHTNTVSDKQWNAVLKLK